MNGFGRRRTLFIKALSTVKEKRIEIHLVPLSSMKDTAYPFSGPLEQ